jgi:NADPH:quinone reductase-like Zn-dependent oxidoreductase
MARCAWGTSEKLELVDDGPVPTPASLPRGSVLIRVLATTATYTDLMVLSGNYRPAIPLPATPGYECIGVIAGVGQGNLTPLGGGQALSVGTRIAAMPRNGCASTHIVLPANACVPIRADVAPEKAVCMVLTGVTAWQMLTRASGTSGGSPRFSAPTSRILVHACMGGTGSMLVALAKAAGLPSENIYGTCSGRNVEAARSQLGIKALDYTKTGDGAWDAEVRKGTGGRGVDLVFDSVVLKGYQSKGVASLRKGGKYVAFGLTSSEAPGSVPIPAAIGAFTSLFFQQKLWSWFSGKEAEFYNVADRQASHPADFAKDLRALLDLVAQGKVDPLAGGRIWGLEEAKGAWQAIQSGAHRGKQVIKVAAE